MFCTTEPIQNLLRNIASMKSFEYSVNSFQQHHHLIHTAASIRTDISELALDLTKPRRDSSDTKNSLSYEELSMCNENPNDSNSRMQIHHRDFPNIKTLSPEHRAYHYNFDHSLTPGKDSSSSRSPLENFEMHQIKNYPQAQINNSPSPPSKSFSSGSSPHYERYEISKIESSLYTPTTTQISHSPVIEHDESNDAPSTNISSSSSVASSQKSPSTMMVVTGRENAKLSRPFKAYPRDPLSLATAGSMLDGSSAEKYAVFRKRMLEQIHAANGGSSVINNPKMRRISNKSVNGEETNNNEPSFLNTDKTKLPNNLNDKDDAYYERRRKNNAAAKKSRDRRRIKEDEIAIRAAFLERENIELKFELAAARKQLAIYANGITT